MPQMTRAERAEAQKAVDEIRRRPSFHLACLFLEHRCMVNVWWPNSRHHVWVPRIGEPGQFRKLIGITGKGSFGYPIHVGWLQNVIKRTHGIYLSEETLAVALCDRGFEVWVTRSGNLKTNLGENCLLEALIEDNLDQGADSRLRAARFTRYSDAPDPEPVGVSNGLPG